MGGTTIIEERNGMFGMNQTEIIQQRGPMGMGGTTIVEERRGPFGGC